MALDLQHLWAVGEVVTAANANLYIGPPPNLVNVDPFHTAISNMTWDTLTINTSHPYNAFKASTGAQNSEINFDVLLAAGTWTVELIHEKNSDQGIITVQLSVDGSTFISVGSSPYNASGSTIDTYNASALFGQRSSLTGITVGTTGLYRLKLLMATKNASSSSYTGRINHVLLQRTA